MKVETQKLPKSEVKLIIELDEEQTGKYMDEAAKQISEVVKVSGFRPGHVPMDIVKQHVGVEAIEDRMLDLAIPRSYGEAVIKEKVQAISRPKIEIIGRNPLKYEAVVAVYPEVSVAGYEKISIKKNEIKMEEKDVDEVLDNIRKNRAKYNEVERPAKMGDKVEVSFEGYDEGGALLESTKSKNHPVVLGEGSLVPGFEEELVGMKAGEEKKFKVTFPKDYFHKPFQGKNVEFKAEMLKVFDMDMPEMTPEFIEQIAGAPMSLDEVRKNISENVRAEKVHQEKDRMENAFLEELIGHTKVELPESLIDEEIDGMIEEFKNDLEGRGITLDKYLETTKKEIKDMRDDRRKEAEKRLNLRFGLQKIFELEKIEVTEADLIHEIEHIKELYPPNERYKLDKEYKEGSYLKKRLENKLKIDKVFEKYLGK